jgi:hypothetical protein
VPPNAGLPLIRTDGVPGASKSPVTVEPPFSVVLSPSICCTEPSTVPLIYGA